MIDVSAVICIIVLLYSVIVECYMPFVMTVTVDRKKTQQSLKSTRYLFSDFLMVLTQSVSLIIFLRGMLCTFTLSFQTEKADSQVFWGRGPHPNLSSFPTLAVTESWP